MSQSFAHFSRRAATVVLVSGLAACASMPPPTGELAAAQQAVVRADGADADQYAAQEIALARSELAQAQAAMSDGREAEARSLALAAAADADLAYARSREALATAELQQRRAEVEQLRGRLQTGDRP
ncbi:membrane protein [Lysobacter bugurensis]|uniref:Membrane protein n=2 Tax=Cognatilysobacter bugurensis TaxID=543356 RepID=A0A918T383_9GAMM|nr:membrane protein [Lysobacter bugurensis]